MKLPLIYTEVSWDHTCNKSCLPINKTKQSITKNISQGYVGHLTSVVNKILPRSMSMCLETINDYNQICFILTYENFFFHPPKKLFQGGKSKNNCPKFYPFFSWAQNPTVSLFTRSSDTRYGQTCKNKLSYSIHKTISVLTIPNEFNLIMTMWKEQKKGMSKPCNIMNTDSKLQ